MADYTALKAAIASVIKTNGNQEITGLLLQQTLHSMIDGVNTTKQDSIAFVTQTLNKFLRDDNTFQEIPTPTGSFTNNVYLSTTDSDIPTYDVLNYVPDVGPSVIANTIKASDGNKTIATYLYPAGLATILVPAGLWSFLFNAYVSSAVGNTNIGVQCFIRTTGGAETNLFTVWGDPLSSTSMVEYKVPFSGQAYPCNLTDRMGIRVLLRTTSTPQLTVSYIVGDGYSSYFNTPIAIRHKQLRDLNEDANFQHITNTEKTKYETAYTDRMKWNGGSTGLVAATARTSLGLVIGVDVLAYRIFGSAANNNTNDFAPATSGGGYIQNQIASAQTANFWISGKAKMGTLVIPASATLASGEVGLYTTESGFTGETPSGAGSVTSIALTVPTGLRVKKDAGGTFAQTATITESGEFIVEIASTYFLPTTTQWATKLDTSLKRSVNGLAELDGNGFVKNTQLPSYIDDVIEADNFAALPATGEAGKIYVTKDDNKTWRWGGTVYVQMYAGIALGETSATAYRGDRGKTAYDHSQLTTGNPHSVTAAQVGALGVNDSAIGITSTSINEDTLALTNSKGWYNWVEFSTALSGYNFGLHIASPDANYGVQLASQVGSAELYFRRKATTYGAWQILWNSGNSNLSTVNWSAAKLTSTTLLLPQVAPTLASGEMAIYGLESGFSGELPSGAGSVDSVALVSNLTGISVSGSPITTSGTFTLNFVSGYQLMTTTESTKLAGIAANANNYSLPIATDTILGGVKIGSNITITDGVISVATPYSLPTATDSVLGGVKIGSNITITEGVISVHNAVTLGENQNGLSLSTQVLSLGLASASTNGALSSTDWSTFNGKEPAIGTKGSAFNKDFGTTAGTVLEGRTFGTAANSATTDFLGATAKATDSEKLDGLDSTGYIFNQNAVSQSANIRITGAMTVGATIGSGKINAAHTLSKTNSGEQNIVEFYSVDETNPCMFNLYSYGAASQADRVWAFQTSERGVANSGILALQPYGGNVLIGYNNRSERFAVNGTTYFNGASTVVGNLTATENIFTNLRIPKVAPTSPTSGEYYFYIVE